MASHDSDSQALDDFLESLVNVGVYGGDPVEMTPEARRALDAMPIPIRVKQEEITEEEDAVQENDAHSIVSAAPGLTRQQKELKEAIRAARDHPISAYRVIRNLIEKAEVFLGHPDGVVGLEDQAVVDLAVQLGASSLSAKTRKH